MSVLVPRIGITDCSRAVALLKNYSDTIVGTFWVMSGYGFKDDIPSWWVDIVLKDNQALAILNAYEKGYFSEEHDGPLYLGFCIIVTADRGNPGNISYVIQHLRMEGFEGVRLLKTLAEHNIPALTEVSYPIDFLHARYGHGEGCIPKALERLEQWTVQIWEDYCSYLMAEHGQEMTKKYWERTR